MEDRDAEVLTRDVRRLVERLAGSSGTWYAARPDGTATRAELLRALVLELAALGVRAGTGQPPEARPGNLGNHALGDQLTLLAHEVAAAPHAADVLPDAVAAVRDVRRRL